VASVAVVRTAGDSAVLAVTDAAGAQRQVELVREKNGWRVRIPPPP
jgi:hypothetical protein